MDLLILCIQEWLNGCETRTIPMLAKRTGVSASTIRRILNKEQDAQEPTARKLLRVISTPIQYIEIMSGIFPESTEHLSFVSSGDKKATDVGVTYFNDDPISFEIFVATSNPLGYSERKLVERLGTNGQKKIESLLENEKITLQNGRLYTDEILFTTEESILNACDNVSALIRRNLDHLKGMYFCTDRYSDNDLKKIAAAAVTFVTTMKEINKNKEKTNQMSKPSCVSIVFGSIDGEE